MDEMNITECLQCGGDLKTNPKTGVPTCIYCGREYKDSVGSYSYDLQEIVNRRQMREFIQAEELCKELLHKQPESSEAYWQTLLSTLGVVYVQEEGRAKPTFFSYTYDDRELIKDNEYYKKAIMYARSSENREFYQSKAEELDVLLKEFFNLVAKENSYDIFISFKKTTEAIVDGERRTIDTDDYIKAREIYDSLKDKYKVFFSPVSIGADTGIEGEKYEPRILKALQTSQAMILIGSRKEYLEAQWVENEWRRYQYFIQKGNKQKQSLILGYFRNMPSLPTALKDIQLPSFDMFKGNYLKELRDKLSFVRSSKGLKSVIGERKIKSDFKGEEGQFNFGYNVTRVEITDKGESESIQISATEERDMETAEYALHGGDFQHALTLYSAILAKNPNNSRAYIGRFCAKLRVKEYTAIKAKAYSAKESDYEDFEQAIQCSNDKEFSWQLVDYLIDGLKLNAEWHDLKKIYNIVIKYVDRQRVDKVFAILANHNGRYLHQGKLKICEDIFESARKIFLEENLDANIDYMKNYAMLLLRNKHFDYAQKYFEELALVRMDSEFYLNLLQCKLKTFDITKKVFTLQVNDNDDASQKKPSELDLDEIIERILICDAEKKNKAISKVLMQMVLYQIAYNEKNVKPFIEVFVSCYSQLNMQVEMEAFLLEVANRCIQLKKFKQAKIYYTEVLSKNANNSKAHWGLLKCKLKAFDDNDVAKKRNSLMKIQEFKNAMNCADNEEYQHYMAVYNGQMSKSTPNRLAYLSFVRKKRVAIRLVVSILILSIVGLGVFQYISKLNTEKYYAQFSFTELDNGTYSVAIAENTTLSGKLEIPSDYNGKAVTVISENGFKDCDSISELLIPDSIVSIESGAFEDCSKLTRINIGNGVETLGANAFDGCNNVISLTLGEKLATIDETAFSGCYKLIELYNLSQIQISTEDESGIGSYVLDVYTTTDSNSKLSEKNDFWYYNADERTILVSYSGMSNNVIIPEGSGDIELFKYAFSNNDWITDITIPGNVVAIGSNAFTGCEKLKTVDYTGDLAKWCAIDFASSSSNPMSITKGININGSNVNELTIPEGVTSIGNFAFYNCSSAYNVTIPESVVSIGVQAFSKCTGLGLINYNAIQCESIPINADIFYMAGRDRYGMQLIIGKNVKAIPDYMFSATYFGSIQDKAYKSPNINYITFEENSTCERIGNYAFYFGFELASVSLPDTITYIGDYAFYQCARLDEITIPKNVTYLGNECFSACSNLENIYFNAENCNDLTSLSRVFGLAGDNTSGCTVTIGANVKRIPAYLFSMTGFAHDNITRVTFASNSQCKSIGANAFTSCLKLKSVYIPKSVDLIEKNAFNGCTVLTSITFENKNGWYVTSDASSTTGQNITISLASDAATKLVNDYKLYYWKRAE